MLETEKFIRFQADVSWVWENREKLTEKEVEFIDDLRQQIKEYGEWIHLSEKQLSWLAALERRVSGEN